MPHTLARAPFPAELEPKPGTPHCWWNAAIPIAIVVGLVVGGMVDTGLTKSNAKGVKKDIFTIFSNASSFKCV